MDPVSCWQEGGQGGLVVRAPLAGTSSCAPCSAPAPCGAGWFPQGSLSGFIAAFHCCSHAERSPKELQTSRDTPGKAERWPPTRSHQVPEPGTFPRDLPAGYSWVHPGTSSTGTSQCSSHRWFCL